MCFDQLSGAGLSVSIGTVLFLVTVERHDHFPLEWSLECSCVCVCVCVCLWFTSSTHIHTHTPHTHHTHTHIHTHIHLHSYTHTHIHVHPVLVHIITLLDPMRWTLKFPYYMWSKKSQVFGLEVRRRNMVLLRNWFRMKDYHMKTWFDIRYMIVLWFFMKIYNFYLSQNLA